jgi:ABC-type transport system involved in multi-copper enzyme maturation permease subunit
MPAIINWLLRLAPTNPICMRLVQGGSRRKRHYYIRAGYLGVMIVVLLFVMLPSSGAASLRELAHAGATTFDRISYLQVALICLLTPVFMAGAIAQEANPQTWDILLTSPLNSLQIVLGNLFGRLFFILALLLSTLPLFAMTQYFGGVPGDSIFTSYLIAGTSALVVASIAITLCVTRTAGRRAVFIFYVAVVMYLFITYAIDQWQREPVGPGTPERWTTIMTPLNPFLALEVLLRSNEYIPRDLSGSESTWLARLWFSRPIAAFVWLGMGTSVFLMAYSTLRVRALGARTGAVPWYRRLLRLGAKGGDERPARHVGHNPIAWREAVARGNTLPAIVGRWGFVVVGLAVAFTLIGLFHNGSWSAKELRLALGMTIAAEIVIIVLVALNMSATAVSREREDGTLDLILTTPIQPGAYLAGKVRGLIQFLIPMLLVPTLTMLLASVYVLTGGLGVEGGVTVQEPNPGGAGLVNVPIVLPVGAITLPLTLAPFIALCVMIGLQWSIKSRGTIGSVIAAFGVVLTIFGVLTVCALPSADMNIIGPLVSALSPISLLRAVIDPVQAISGTIQDNVGAGLAPIGVSVNASLLIGSALAAAAYVGIVIGMRATMTRTFMTVVRRLAGAT